MLKVNDPSPLPIPDWQSKMLPGWVWGFIKLPKMLPIVYAFAWNGRLSFGSRVLLNTVEVRGTPPVVGTMLHDWGGSPGGCSTFLCCGGGGGMPLLVDSECLG